LKTIGPVRAKLPVFPYFARRAAGRAALAKAPPARDSPFANNRAFAPAVRRAK